MFEFYNLRNVDIVITTFEFLILLCNYNVKICSWRITWQMFKCRMLNRRPSCCWHQHSTYYQLPNHGGYGIGMGWPPLGGNQILVLFMLRHPTWYPLSDGRFCHSLGEYSKTVGNSFLFLNNEPERSRGSRPPQMKALRSLILMEKQSVGNRQKN